MFSTRARFIALIAIIVIGWALGFSWFIGQMPQQQMSDVETVEGVVVLTGGSMRVDEGIRLITRGKAKKLLISGVGEGVSLDSVLEASSYPTLNSLAAFNERIDLGYSAEDTKGNAFEAQVWAELYSYDRLGVVTSGYHMPRALYEFQAVMPDKELVAIPVLPEHVPLDGWWNHPNTIFLFISEYNKYLLTVLRVYFWGA